MTNSADEAFNRSREARRENHAWRAPPSHVGTATVMDVPARRLASDERSPVQANGGEGLDHDVLEETRSRDVGSAEAHDVLRKPVPTFRLHALGAPTSEASRLKEQVIRDAVAAITRRQRTLDAGAPDARLPHRDGAVEEAGRSVVGDAMQALETRLATERDARSGRASADAPRLDPHSADAFKSLGDELRKAIDTLAEGGPVSGVGKAAPRVDEARRDLMASTAMNSPPGTSPAPQPMPFRSGPGVTAAVLEPDLPWGEIRALLDRLGPGSPIEVLDRRMGDLASKVERHLDHGSPTALIEDMARRIDAIQSSAASTPLEVKRLDQLLRASEDRLAKASAASLDIQRFEDMMQGLAGRVDALDAEPRAPDAAALRAQIERLGSRLDRSETSLSALGSLEANLRDVFSHIEQTRDAVIGAAEHAARTAARDTLREAMNSPAITDTADRRGAQAEEMVREVQDLKLRHDASERRTEEALTSLQQAIDVLVKRLERNEVGAHEDLPTRQRVPVASRHEADPNPRPPVFEEEPGSIDRSSDLGAVEGLIEPGTTQRIYRSANPGREPAPSAPGLGGAISASAPSVDIVGSASFIAAARRAAQSAHASAASHAAVLPDEDDGPPSSIGSSLAALLERARHYVVLRRRPLLLSLAGLVLMLGAIEIVQVTVEAPSSAGGPTASSAPSPKAIISDQSALAADVKVTPRVDVEAARPPDASAAASAVPAPTVSEAPSTVSAEADPTVAPAAAPPRTGNPFLAGIEPADAGIGAGLKAAATSGDAAAQYEVALRYADGRAVARDPKAALAWFAKAASQGLAPAQYRLGLAYEKGIGTSRDSTAALTWYTKAADAGNVKAMHNLAVMAAEGAIGKPDYAKAATLFGKASDLGVRDSQFNLAILLARGLGIEQNLVRSYTWFAIAAAQGDEDAARKRDDVAARLDVKSIEAAKAAVADFKPLPSVRAANEVVAPSGGWDALTAPGPAGKLPALAPKVTTTGASPSM